MYLLPINECRTNERNTPDERKKANQRADEINGRDVRYGNYYNTDNLTCNRTKNRMDAANRKTKNRSTDEANIVSDTGMVSCKKKKPREVGNGDKEEHFAVKPIHGSLQYEKKKPLKSKNDYVVYTRVYNTDYKRSYSCVEFEPDKYECIMVLTNSNTSYPYENRIKR